MKTINVKVTKDDIKNGVRQSECRCPIALAIKRDLGLKKVEVSGTITFPESGLECINNSTPGVNFFHRFDQGLPVNPFTLKLRVPDIAYHGLVAGMKKNRRK
jgi:hypothetical protein